MLQIAADVFRDILAALHDASDMVHNLRGGLRKHDCLGLRFNLEKRHTVRSFFQQGDFEGGLAVVTPDILTCFGHAACGPLSACSGLTIYAKPL